MGENWNGYDAEPFEPSFVAYCRTIFSQLISEPEVFPTARNSIQFEFENDEVYLEFEVFSDCVDIFVMKNGKSEKDYQILKQFVIDNKFDHLGAFTYSKEEDTRSFSISPLLFL